MKYGLSTLMLIVFAASIIFGIAARGSFTAFAIGFVAAAVLLVQLIAESGPRPIVVQELATDADAHLLRNFLLEHGVDARVDGSLASDAYPSVSRPRVVVPPAQFERTRALLQEFDERRDSQSHDDERPDPPRDLD